MRAVVYCVLSIIFVACIWLIVFLLHGPKEKETFSALAGVLAVMAAAIAVLPTLRILELQEASLRPRPTPYFDLTSRHDLLQLRVKNFGASTAYDVELRWKTHPVDHEGNKVQSLDRISALVPQESVSALMGVAHSMVRRLADTRFEGECHFRDSSGKRQRQGFVCSVDARRKQLLSDDELPKTLRELQDIPQQLARIADHLERPPQQP